jgi:hypothetical protein
LAYDTGSNALIFAGGAYAEDKSDTWKISLNSIGAGWIKVTDIPYNASDISFVTPKDGAGKEHLFVLGGHQGDNEQNGNLNTVVEYSAASDAWIARAPLPEARGHASHSTIAYGCGFLVVGGVINSGGQNKVQTDDISYYHIPTDTWKSIGKLVLPVKAAICAIYEDYLYCSGGYSKKGWRRALDLGARPPLTAPTPTAPTVPTPKPPTASPPTVPDNCFLDKLRCKGRLGLVSGYTMHKTPSAKLFGKSMCTDVCVAENLVAIKNVAGWECGACPYLW